MLSTSLLRPDLGDRRTRLALGIAVMGALIAAFVYTIGTGDLRLTIAVAAIAVAPALLVLALKRSYLFPYGLYVVLIPFDNMLKISGSGTLTKMLGILSTIFIMVYAIRRKGLNKPPLTLYLWLLFLTWLVFSLLWTPDVSNGMIDVEQMVSLIAMYAVLSVAPVEERDVRAVCACIVIGGVAASFYGMYLLHANPVPDAGAAGEASRLMINVSDRTIDANHFANAMLLPLAMCLVALLNARKPFTVLGSLFALGILVSGILMSLSREAMMACIVIIVVVILFSKRRLLGLAIGGPLLILTPMLVPSIGQRMGEAFSTGGAGRTSIWLVAWQVFKQHPFFGVGAGGFIEAYDRNYLSVYQAYIAGWSRPPHNTLLHAAAELGVIGLILVVVAYASSFRHFSMIRRGDSMYDLRIVFTATLVALALVSNFIDLLNYKYVWLALTTVAQMRTVVAMRRSRAVPQSVAYETPAPAAPRRRGRRTAAAVP